MCVSSCNYVYVLLYVSPLSQGRIVLPTDLRLIIIQILYNTILETFYVTNHLYVIELIYIQVNEKIRNFNKLE